MIVVIGSAAFRQDTASTGSAVGLAPEIAAAAVEAGARVEMLARVGEDGAGDEVLLALARAGVGHLAVLRDPAHPTALAPAALEPFPGADELAPALLVDMAAGDEAPIGGPAVAVESFGAPALEPADLSLGLRYLREFGVVVAVGSFADGGAAVIADAASFEGAALVVVAPPGAVASGTYPSSTLIEAPADDPDGAFARVVGRYAAALDAGVPPAEAFLAATERDGWEAAAG